MTIKELKKALENVPEDLDVMVHQIDDETTHNMAENAFVEDVLFGAEDIPCNEWPTEKCFVIKDH